MHLWIEFGNIWWHFQFEVVVLSAFSLYTTSGLRVEELGVGDWIGSWVWPDRMIVLGMPDPIGLDLGPALTQLDLASGQSFDKPI